MPCDDSFLHNSLSQCRFGRPSQPDPICDCGQQKIPHGLHAATHTLLPQLLDEYQIVFGRDQPERIQNFPCLAEVLYACAATSIPI